MKKTVLVLACLLTSLFAFSQTCTLSLSLSATDTSLCQGNSTSLITKITGGTAPFRYSWSTGDTTATISVNKAGTYKVSVSDQTPGCQPVTQNIVIKSIASPVAPTAKGLFICQNAAVMLTASAPGGLYQWFDAPNAGHFLASGDTLITPVITATTTFYVQTTVSGCVSPRTAVTVQMAPKPTVSQSVACAFTPATLTASGADSYTWYDSPTGGNIISTSATLVTPPLSVSKTYYLAATTNGCTGERLPEIAKVAVPPPPPIVKNQTVCYGSPANLHADDTQMGILNWYSLPAGGYPLISSPDYTTPPLTASATYYVENSFDGCSSLRVPVQITVQPLPQTPANQIDSTCNNSSIVLTASANPAGTYNWYDAPIAGNLIATGNTFTTPALKYSTTYYVENSNAICTSSRATVTVIVKPFVLPPSVSRPLICPGTSTTLTATYPGGVYQWYDAPAGGNLLATGPGFTTPVLTVSKTYYVQTTISGCTSQRTAVPVTILAPPAAPKVDAMSVCSGSVATLTASGSSGNYAWYDSQTGGNYLSFGAVFNTPVLTKTTTYYVEATTVLGCEGPRTAVKVTVDPIPGAPKVTAAPPVCPGTPVTLSATSAGGGINQWYDQGGNLLATGNTFTTPPLHQNTTYYVQNAVGSCVSPRTAVTASIITVANPQFQYPSGTACSHAANLTPVINDPAGGTFSASPAGLVFANNHTGEINTGLSKPGIYTITFTGNGPCPGPTVATINISVHPNTGFSYEAAYCKDGPNPTPIFPTGSSAGAFSATPSGLIFTNSITGEINLKESLPGIYIITNKIPISNRCGAGEAQFKIVIMQPVTISAGANQTVDAGVAIQLKGSVSGATAKWSGGKGSFSNNTSPDAIYTPAAGETLDTLTFTSSDPSGPCGPKSSSVIITIRPASTGLEACTGSPVNLSPSTIIPGDTYQWFDAGNGGHLLSSSARFITPPLNKTTTYYLQTTGKNGTTSDRTPITVTINSSLTPPVVGLIPPVCLGSPAALTASGSPGGYQWYDAPVGGHLLSTSGTYATPQLYVNTSYYVQASLGECISPRTKVDVVIVTPPSITSAASGIICSGDLQNYAITSNVPGAAFLWTRAQVKGISNAAAINQTSATIAEALINTSSVPVKVTYQITPANGTCAGDPFNYIVTVYPRATVISPDTAMVCAVSPDDYTFKFSAASVVSSWSRAAVPGISNLAVSGQTVNNLQEVLFNTTNAPIKVVYALTYKTPLCDGTPFNLVITVNPVVRIASAANGMACSGVPQDYVIKSTVAHTTYVWSRAAAPNISNKPVSNKTTDTITEALVNTGPAQARVTYTIIPYANGCAGSAFNYTVIVNPVMVAPAAKSNSPVCLNSNIQLNTPPVNGAVYSWTGPNGFTSAQQNPTIKDVSANDAGTYTLNITVNGCTSPTASVDVKVDQLPIANAGPDQTVCRTTPGVTLAGIISGGTTTGVWSTNGTGKFSPVANQLNAVYIPSAQDRLKDSVTLTLSSTSKDDCHIATAEMSIKFSKLPGADAGPDQRVCSQIATATLSGKIFTSGAPLWKTSGSGSFSPSANVLNPTYHGSSEDVKNGSVKLTLLETSPDSCFIPTSQMTVNFIPPASLNAGGTRYVMAGNTITLTPSVSENDVHYQWSPNINISNDTVKNPVITGDIDRSYTLTITDSRGCQSQDITYIKVSPPIKIPNTFTPNGDGINDHWNIDGMIAYTNATIDIFDRAGQSIYHSIGYNKAWDGTYNGKTLPPGTYYYVINTKYNDQVLSGPVTIIR